MIVSKFLSDANGSLGRVSKYQNQVDSTKRIARISDDPLATLTALKARNKLSNLGLYESNISAATRYLTEAESSVSELNEICQSAYEAMQGAQSGAKGPDELNIIKEEIYNLQKEVLSISNNSMGSSYIFSGYNFTGSTDGVTKTAPFSISDTGDLLYNGVNLSKFSWKDEFDTNIGLLPDFASSITDAMTALDATGSDSYAKGTLCQNAQEALTGLLSSAKDALKAASKFGIDNSSPEYAALSGVVDDIETISGDFSNTISKELAGSYILDTDPDPSLERNEDGSINKEFYEKKGISVLTADELANRFSITDVKTALSQIDHYIHAWTDDLGDPQDALLDTAVTGLSGIVTITTDEQDALTAELTKRTTLPIGVEQSLDFAITGVDLLGKGKDNIYHVLDKCVQMLEDGASSKEISGMITELQDAQKNVLTLQTKIGSTENRMKLISDRYTTSKANYTEMKSEAEDVDMAEAITNLNTAKTVYSAALAAGAKIMQTSLIDFLR